MYYCLNKACVLRGWDKLPTGIVKRLSGQATIVDPALYNKILNSPWVLFEGSPFLADQERMVLDNLTEQGMMALSDSPAPLAPEQEYRNRCAGGCRGNASYTGGPMAADPRACRFFKDGWYEKTCRLIEEYAHRT